MRPGYVLSAAALALTPLSLAGQGVAVGASRWLSSPKVSEYRLGLDGFGSGPFSYRPTLQYLRQGGESRAVWAGVGGDLIVRTTAAAQPYLIGGAGLGLGRAAVGSLGPAVGAWGGLGAELLTLGPLGVQAEALYTWRGRMQVRSVSLGFRIGSRIGRERAESRTSNIPSAALPGPAPQDEETIRLATAAGASSAPSAGVVGTALSVMGAPYRWGGTSTDGFDCSGLIQYSYAQHGITLPRRSLDQAKAGRPVDRRLEALAPGDILTFGSEPGGEVAHVGLYLGDGRFIHSADGGVQTSLLSPTDAAGGWWYARWLGARRVLEQ
jgi:NlpC/P60 family protein